MAFFFLFTRSLAFSYEASNNKAACFFAIFVLRTFFSASFLSPEPELCLTPSACLFAFRIRLHFIRSFDLFLQNIGTTMTLCDVKRVDFYFALLCLLSVATVCAP